MSSHHFLPFVYGFLLFLIGTGCGAGLVYRLRHVTTKSMHWALLNCLRERTAALDRLNTYDLHGSGNASPRSESDKLEIGNNGGTLTFPAGLRLYRGF